MELYSRARTFVLHDLWILDLATVPTAERWFLQPLRVLLIALRGFFIEHQGWLRAASLTYYTLLALVPLLAFMFAFLKGLGVQNKIEPWLIGQISAGSEDTLRQIIQFINNVKVGTLGMISLGVMIFTTFLQLGTIEQSFNTIWGVQKGRSIVRKLSDYVSVVVLAPVFLTIALSAGNQPLVEKLLDQRLIGYAMTPLFTLLPAALIWLSFSFVYAYMPNTRVRLVPALVGGLIGSLLWQVAKWGYLTFQVGIARHEAIYGAFAQFPVLMVWLQLSWMVILFGAELTVACQHVLIYPVGRFASASGNQSTSPYVKEWLANALYFSLIRAFSMGTGPWSAIGFARQQRIPLSLMREVVDTLVQANLLVEAADTPEHYVPGRDPAVITPWHILYAWRHHGEESSDTLMIQSHSPATPLMMQVEAACREVADTQNMSQWLAASEARTQRQDQMV
jgi:membrane protein